MEDKRGANNDKKSVEKVEDLNTSSRVPSKSRRKRRCNMSSEELKACLQQLDWSQRDLARFSCVSLSAVKKWAQGRVHIPGPVAVLLRVLIIDSMSSDSSYLTIKFAAPRTRLP